MIDYRNTKSIATRFVQDESGATAIEYAMIAAGVGIGISVAVFQLGTTVNGFFQSIVTFFAGL